MKHGGDFPTITPRPRDVANTQVAAAEVAVTHSALQSVRLPSGIVEMTPPPDKALIQPISLGRSCGCPCHKPGRLDIHSEARYQ